MPPLPQRIDTRRTWPASLARRRVVILSRPGQSSCLSMTQEGLCSMIRMITFGVMTTLVVSG